MGDQESFARFGISIPKELASEVERCASSLGLTRSKLIEVALRSFISYVKMKEDGGRGLVALIVVHGGNSLNDILKRLLACCNSVSVQEHGGVYVVTTVTFTSLKDLRPLLEWLRKVKHTALHITVLSPQL